jgi:fructose-specific phosphotransferase system component IIB
MTFNLQRLAGAALLAAAAVVLAGCASGALKENMAAAAPSVAYKKTQNSVRVETRGGSDTGAMDSTNISNADLKSAIEASIAKSGLFRNVAQSNSDYALSVTVTELTKPLFGGSFTVTMEAGWTLTKTSDNKVLLRKAIKSSHTASLGDSLVGVTRLRLAVEGAARSNIEQGLKAVSDAL